jgi:hypothetical protein
MYHAMHGKGWKGLTGGISADYTPTRFGMG